MILREIFGEGGESCICKCAQTLATRNADCLCCACPSGGDARRVHLLRRGADGGAVGAAPLRRGLRHHHQAALFQRRLLQRNGGGRRRPVLPGMTGSKPELVFPFYLL